MRAIKPKFNPAQDRLIATFFLHLDEDGNFLDIDTHLYHSETYGFYLQEKRAQMWIKRCWENMKEENHQFSATAGPRRVLTSPCRAMTPAQVIRLIVENHIPEEQGARAMTLAALEASGMI